MTVIRKIKRIILTSSLPYTQVFCVFLAFAVMAAASFLYSVNIEKQHLEKDAAAFSEQIEERLTTNLHELKTFMSAVSETIRIFLLRGADFEEIKTYLVKMTDFGLHENDGITGFNGFYALFDIFDGNGINGLVPDLDWVNDMPDYIPQTRPWYIAANKSNGEIVETNSYVDALSHEVSFTYARSLYDNKGRRLAIVCLDVLLSRINEISTEQSDLSVHSWMMLDRDLTIISYPFEEFLGMKISDAKGSGIEDIADRLERGLPVLSRRFVNPAGEIKRYSVRQTKHGWYIGVSTPEDIYYTNVKSILWFLIISGFFMSIGLSIILLRIVSQKNMLINLGNIMDGLDIMIFVTDPKTDKILFINKSMKRKYGITEDSVGKICYKILKKTQNERCGYCPCYALDKEPDNTIVWDERCALSGSIYQMVDRYIKWPNGQTAHIQHSVDITELIAAKEAAESSSRSKGYFLAQVSHEIRTPMNAILGISEIQLLNKNIPAETEEGYRRIHESGSLLLNIINDILDFSKIDAGRLEIVHNKYDVPSLISDAAQLNHLRFKNKRLTFIVNLDENTPYTLIGDELRIKQILNNLLSNAFKYTEEGEIEFSIRAETNDIDDTAALIFTVRDTGQGMTESQVSRVFDEYSRFNLETNRSVSGTGLGMSITKRLVDLMNGSISIQSEPAKGTVFTVNIPQKRIDKTVCGKDLADKLRNFSFQNMAIAKKIQFMREYMPYGSVLVVDDVVSNIYVAKGMLLPYGLKIDIASSGFDAVKKIKDGNIYDIIFMDHMMPKMDGIEAVKIIRSMGYAYPVVALTANALIGQDKIFLDNGFDDFISKPIDSREMNHILNEFIRNKKPREIVEAARREQMDKEQKYAQLQAQTQEAFIDNELTVAAVSDIETALVTFEELLPAINSGNTDLALFTTTVHGMKSALANIGEKRLSDAALALEKLGDKGDISVILSETTAFMNLLVSLLERIRFSKTGGIGGSGEISREDKDILRSELNNIKTACEKLVLKDIKSALGVLKQKRWPYKINNVINEISVYFIRGEYKYAAAAVDKIIVGDILYE